MFLKTGPIEQQKSVNMYDMYIFFIFWRGLSCINICK